MTSAETRVAVVGDGGVLHRAVTGLLGARALPAPADEPSAPRGVVALLTVTDARLTDPARDRHQHRAAALGIPLLSVWTEGDRALVGPTVTPGVPGCLRCLSMRRAHARDDRATARAVLEHAPEPASEPSSLLTGAAAAVTAHLLSLIHVYKRQSSACAASR